MALCRYQYAVARAKRSTWLRASALKAQVSALAAQRFAPLRYMFTAWNMLVRQISNGYGYADTIIRRVLPRYSPECSGLSDKPSDILAKSLFRRDQRCRICRTLLQSSMHRPRDPRGTPSVEHVLGSSDWSVRSSIFLIYHRSHVKGRSYESLRRVTCTILLGLRHIP